MTVRTLTTEVWLPHPQEQVFDFFADAGNLQTLTPPWLHFQILTPAPITLAEGTQIDYRIRWRGLPLRWRTRITAWRPPHGFIDRQERGPYSLWVHEHTFEPRDGGTLMRDRVDYAVPGWIFEPLLCRYVVGPDVNRIFDYRRSRMEELFNRDRPTPAGLRSGVP